MVTLTEARKIATAVVDSPSANTSVEIRAADNPNPDLDDTKVIGQGVLNNGRSEIKLDIADPTRYVLVWITRLTPFEGNRMRTEISELTFLPAP
jgi:putative peptidoglycan lipid II flippase